MVIYSHLFPPAQTLHFLLSTTYGLLDSAKYSMNGTTVQSVSGYLECGGVRWAVLCAGLL
jgi:hypothetical protein